MAENAYLDGAGVAQVWQATKDYVASHAQPVTSGTEDEAAWLTRETAGGFPVGGRATIQSIKGNTVVQGGALVSVDVEGLVSTGKNLLDPSKMGTPTSDVGVTAIYDNGTFKISGTPTSGWRWNLSTRLPLTVGTYTVSVDAARSNIRLRVYDVDAQADVTRIDPSESSETFTIDSARVGHQIMLYFQQATTNTAVSFNGHVMLQAGSTATPYEPYWSQAISIPLNTLKPEGLRSAGSAHDELTETAVITRIASANLGDRTWNAYSSGAGKTYYCNLTNSVPTKAGGLDNLNSVEHALGTSSTALADGEMIGGSTNNRVYIRDDSCSTADAMKTARAGETLYYEMAEPTTVTIDPPLNLTYRTEAGGTETVTHTEATSAPTLDVVYEIDGTAAAASIAPLEGRIASTNYALGALLMLGGTLVKVTTAIATGEQIVIGQNVEATTVAAELAALA